MPDLSLLLTILSVLAVWALLTALVAGLLLILKTLESIRGTLQKVTAGVRAIEQETAPLEQLAGDIAPTTSDLHSAMGTLARTLHHAADDLNLALPALGAALRR